MSVIVKGMEMPKEGTVIAIYKLNGKFYASLHGTELCPVISLPEKHGRLIDGDEVKTAFPCGESVRTECVRATIDNMPTIVESEGE